MKKRKKVLFRLLKYSKSYFILLLFCLLLVFLSTSADLARPYLIKIAIDDQIGGINYPMIETTAEDDGQTFLYNNNYYKRINIKNISNFKHLYQIIHFENSFYIIDGFLNNKPINSVTSTSPDHYLFQTNLNTFNGTKLSSNEYNIFRQYDLQGLKQTSIIFLFILIGSALFNYMQIYILNFVGQKVIYNLRSEVFKHIQSLSLSFFNKNPIGKLVTRATNDMNNINELFTNVLVTLIKDFLLIFGTIIVMITMNFKLTFICLSTIPLLIIISFMFRFFARKSFLEVKKKLGTINAALNENITGMSVIQIFGQEKQIATKFKVKNKQHYDAGIKQLFIFSVFRPSMNIIYTLTLTLLIWFGGGEVIQGSLPFGILFAFINYTNQLFKPIFDLSEKFNIMESAMASSERVFQILDTDEKIVNSNKLEANKPFKGKIEFKNVYFAYDTKWVLKDVSFKIEPGETIAFVGATGSGKTTIISLLTRLYDIQKGQILIDDIDITSLDIKFLRQNISTVLQDVFLFSGTIEDNIRLGNSSISSEKIIEASKFVNAHEFISDFEDNYSHEVVENGATLSSGQKQLISFARALAFNPSILILDEATSNIDTETELLIQDAITKLIKDRTTIVVAHRLSTIQHANKIIVLHNGCIKESGSHSELLNKKGMYHTLYQIQYKDSI